MTIILLLLILPPIIFIFVRLKLKTTRKPKTAYGRITLVFYLSLISLFIVSLIGNGYYIYIKGYRSTSFVFILMTLVGLWYWFVDTKKISTNIARFLLFLFSLITLPLASVLTFELIGDYQNQLIYNDSNYRLEETGRAIMNPCTLPTLFVKFNLYEKKYYFENGHCLTKSQIKKITIEPLPNDQILVTTYSIVIYIEIPLTQSEPFISQNKTAYNIGFAKVWLDNVISASPTI